MSSKPILYSMNLSPAARTVWLTARFLGLELEIRDVNVIKGANMAADFLKLNPQHTVPTLDDNGIVLWESAAICTYLIGKYGPPEGSPLYPNDLVTRARIDQRMYFNAAILFPLLRQSSMHVLIAQIDLPETLCGDIGSALDHLENFLASGKYLVGDQLTLADLAVSTTVSNVAQWLPMPDERYRRLNAWLKRVADAVPFYDELNTRMVNVYGEDFRTTLAKIKLLSGKQ